MVFSHQINKQQYSLFLGIILLFFINSTVAQNPKDNALFIKANELVCCNPDEAIKIGKHLLKNAVKKNESSVFNLLLAEAFQTKGDYENMINHIFQAYTSIDEIENYQAARILFFKSEILKKLYLDSQSEKYRYQAQVLISKFSEQEQQQLILSNKVNRIFICLDRFETQSALELIKDFKNYRGLDAKTIYRIDLAKALSYNSLEITDSATYYFGRVKRYLDENHEPNNYDLSLFQLETSKIYFNKKEYQKSIELLKSSMKIADFLENKLLLKQIHRQLSFNYLALNDNENYKLHDNRFINLINEINNLEQSAVNNAFNLISKEQLDNYDIRQDKYMYYIKIGVGLLIIIIVVSILFFYKNKWKAKRFREILSYLQINEEIFSENESKNKENTKKIVINHETEQAILTKLKKFESSTKFTNKEMSLAVLAGQFDTNTKYLSEIINKHYEKNFNAYINKLRIDFIIKKLKTDPNYMHYKISYLAEKCGFSSHSIFATVFKANTGISPNIFIELLKEETESKSII